MKYSTSTEQSITATSPARARAAEMLRWTVVALTVGAMVTGCSSGSTASKNSAATAASAIGSPTTAFTSTSQDPATTTSTAAPPPIAAAPSAFCRQYRANRVQLAQWYKSHKGGWPTELEQEGYRQLAAVVPADLKPVVDELNAMPQDTSTESREVTDRKIALGDQINARGEGDCTIRKTYDNKTLSSSEIGLLNAVTSFYRNSSDPKDEALAVAMPDVRHPVLIKQSADTVVYELFDYDMSIGWGLFASTGGPNGLEFVKWSADKADVCKPSGCEE